MQTPSNCLDAGAVAFDHLDADAQRVAGAEFGNGLVGGQRVDGFALEGLDQVHFFVFSLVPPRARGRCLRCAPVALDQVRPP